MSKTVVNSWNEWDKLTHVIVGIADNSCIPSFEPALKWEVPVDSAMKGKWGLRPLAAVEKANAQLDAFAVLLKKRGIKVDRPDVFQWNQPAITPDFKTDTMHGIMPPRDMLLTVGSEILSTSMAYRCRYYEYLSLWPLMQKYFDEDPNFRWEQSPRPRLTAASYRPDYDKSAAYLADPVNYQKRAEQVARGEYVTTEAEIMFDAADIMRCGKDLFVQHGSLTNRKAMDWLKRHYRNHRIHRLQFPSNFSAVHIDATFSPLRPGLILNTQTRLLPEEQKEIFEKNGWEIVVSADPAHKESPPLCYCSVWLSTNVLVLDPKTICVEASEEAQMEQLAKLGFEVIPVPFRDVYAFGGGLHCCTADVHREGKCEDYFPKQVGPTRL